MRPHQIRWFGSNIQSHLRYQRQVFESGFFAGALASGGALVVTDNSTGKVVGSSRYYDWNPTETEVAIRLVLGQESLGRRNESGNEAAHAQSRIPVGAKVVWFHVGKNNWRSRKAMEKIGGTFP